MVVALLAAAPKHRPSVRNLGAKTPCRRHAPDAWRQCPGQVAARNGGVSDPLPAASVPSRARPEGVAHTPTDRSRSSGEVRTNAGTCVAPRTRPARCSTSNARVAAPEVLPRSHARDSWRARLRPGRCHAPWSRPGPSSPIAPSRRRRCPLAAAGRRVEAGGALVARMSVSFCAECASI